MAATIQDMEKFVIDINDETNGISDRLDRNTAVIAALKLQVANGGPVTQEQLDALANAFAPLSARLRSLAADPVVPIPPVVVDPPLDPVLPPPVV